MDFLNGYNFYYVHRHRTLDCTHTVRNRGYAREREKAERELERERRREREWAEDERRREALVKNTKRMH